MNKSLHRADVLERLFYYGVYINGSKIHCMFSFKITAQLEYINHRADVLERLFY